MLFVVLAGLSGLVWGVGDFAGGKATQRAPVLGVVWISKLASLPLPAVYLRVLPAPVERTGLGWGALAGLVGLVGLMVFYRALSAGAMAVVAPVTAVPSASIPVAVGLAAGERPGTPALTGVLCALVGIALVSLSPGRGDEPSPLTPRLIFLALTAGAGFAAFFVFLDRANTATSAGAGLWPVAASQLAAVGLGSVLLVRWRRQHPQQPSWPRRAALRWTLVAGPFDMSANALYLVAVRSGELSLVAPLAALYPVTTVLLALAVDRERLRLWQVIGLVLALAALMLVARH